jgi:protein SCO1/2
MTLRALLQRAAAQLSPAEKRQLTAAERRRRRFANVPLQTHEGATVRFYDDLLKDKTVLIQFMYTNCTEQCPLTTMKLVEVQRLLGNQVGGSVHIYSITVDPQRDTAAVLRGHALMHGAKAGWLFLTGQPGDIRQLRGNFGDDPALTFGESNHLNLIAYGVEALERWGSFPAWTEPATMVRLLTAIEPRGARAGAEVSPR